MYLNEGSEVQNNVDVRPHLFFVNYLTKTVIPSCVHTGKQKDFY